MEKLSRQDAADRKADLNSAAIVMKACGSNFPDYFAAEAWHSRTQDARTLAFELCVPISNNR
jgi:hypothetical protein